MLQIHYVRISFVRSIVFSAIGLALVALVACTNGPDDGNPSSSSGGNPPVISSSSGGSVPSESSSSNGDNPPDTSSSSDEVVPSSSSDFSSSSEGGTPVVSSSSGGSVIGNEWPFDSSDEGLTASPGIDGLGLENVIKIEYKNGGAEITKTANEVTVDKDGENVVVRIPNTTSTEYNFVISGTTANGSLKFYGDVRKGLYLNGVSITNSKGPAINIQKSKRVIVHLVNGTQNFLADAPGYVCSNAPQNTEQSKGAFFSEGKLEFEGSGSLEVKGKCNHAIAVDDNFELKNGKITVESVNDGVHANDKIDVSGGVLNIKSEGDAIQSEKGVGKITITGGKIKALTTGIKSHGIASDSAAISIAGKAIVQISVSGNGSKGIRARNWVEFKGNQKTSIKTSGTKHTDPADPEDESNSAGIKLTKDLFVEGGELTIKSLGVGAKGINSDGSATMKDSKVDIEADDNGIKVKGTLTVESGTVTVKSKKTKAINGTLNKKGGTVNTTDGGS